MKAEIVFDKTTEREDLRTGWGVSILFDEKVLFDTGEHGDWLVENLRNLEADVDKIESVVISHDHWDHTGGLWKLLEIKKGLTVCACPRFGPGFKKKVKDSGGILVETHEPMEISRNIFVSGEIPGRYHGIYMPEQALLVRTGRGISIATGCAHPGVVNMIKTVKERFPDDSIYSVFGGFHLRGCDKRVIEGIAEEFRGMGIEKAGPTHCSGADAEDIFKRKYGDNFIEVKVGDAVDISGH